MRAILLAALVAGCAGAAPTCATLPAPSVIVIDRGWHVDLAVEADSLAGPLATLRQVFPGARTFVFGYGKKTFFTAPAESLREYLLGPFPGPAAIEVTGLSVPARAAYPDEATYVLPLPKGRERALSDFIWRDLAPSGAPRVLGPSRSGGLFYAAGSRYGLDHTCNDWAAAALRSAGVRITSAGVLVSGQVVRRAIVGGACLAP